MPQQYTPHDEPRSASITSTTPANSLFSADEIERLSALRERTQRRREGDPEEFGLDLRRLMFARWLAQTGKLNEDW